LDCDEAGMGAGAGSEAEVEAGAVAAVAAAVVADGRRERMTRRAEPAGRRTGNGRRSRSTCAPMWLSTDGSSPRVCRRPTGRR
jgi:hypothetical protein